MRNIPVMNHVAPEGHFGSHSTAQPSPNPLVPAPTVHRFITVRRAGVGFEEPVHSAMVAATCAPRTMSAVAVGAPA